MDGADGSRIGRPEETGRLQQIARFALGLALVVLAVWTLHNFLPALVWAAILGIAVWPLYACTAHRWPPGQHNVLLPLAFTLGVALLFIVPLGLVIAQLSREAHGVFVWIASVQKTGLPVPPFLARLPVGAQEATDWWQANLANPSTGSDLLRRMPRADLMGYGREFGLQLAHRAVLFGFTLLTLFFLFRDGISLSQQMLTVARRAFGSRGERLARQLVASVHGTVDGLVLVGIGVGVLLGIAYAVAGVPHPTMLGALTAVAAMIPFGAPLVFGLASVLLLAQGSTVWAVAILGFGMVVTFAADHFVRPVLIGGATRLPFLWVLFGILGGVETWGLLGLFLGPAILASLIQLWRDWTGETEA